MDMERKALRSNSIRKTLRSSSIRNNLPATKTISIAVINVLDQIEDIISEEEITEAVIITICVSAMQFVNHIPKLNGQDKKQVVLLVLKQIVNNHIDDIQQRLVLFHVIDHIIPVTIDTLVNVDKQKIKLHVRNFFSCCLKTS